MKVGWAVLFLVVFLAACQARPAPCIEDAPSQRISISNYQLQNGESPFGDQSPIHYFDEACRGAGSNNADLSPLVCTAGDLTDGAIAAGRNEFGDLAWVGWRSTDPQITLYFNDTYRLANVTLHLANSQGVAGVGLPASVAVAAGGQLELFSLDEDKYLNPASVTLPLENMTGQGMRVQLFRDTEWLFIDEITIEGAPLKCGASR